MTSTRHHLQNQQSLLLCTRTWIAVLSFSLVCGSSEKPVLTVSPGKNHTVYNVNGSSININYSCSSSLNDTGTDDFFPRPIWMITTCTSCGVGQQLDPKSADLLNNSRWVVEYLSRTESIITIKDEAAVSAKYSRRIIVQCLLFFDTPVPISSPKYFIHLYGPLSTPSNLELSLVNNSRHFFTWSKPQFPPGVNITYFINITNLTSGATIVNTSTTETSLAFFNGTSNSYDCNEINMSVYYEVEADDGVRRSKVENRMENVPISPNISAVSNTLKAAVDFSSGESSLNLGISYLAADVCSKSYPVTRYFATVTDGENRKINKSYDPTSEEAQINFNLNYAESQFLALNHVYTLSITACSNVTCHTSDNVMIYAAYIQNPSIQYSDRNVSLYCELARSSTAKGCQFNFTSNDNTNETFNVLFASNSGACVNENCSVRMCAVTNSLSNNYMNITAYAIFEDGSVSEFGQPITPINITNPEGIPDCFLMPHQQSQMVRVTVGVVVGILALLFVIFVMGTIIVILFVRRRIRHEEQQVIYEKPKLQSTGDNNFSLEVGLPRLSENNSSTEEKDNGVHDKGPAKHSGTIASDGENDIDGDGVHDKGPAKHNRTIVSDGDDDIDGVDPSSTVSIPLQALANSKVSESAAQPAADKPKPLRLTIKKKDNSIVLNVNMEALAALISDRTPLLQAAADIEVVDD